MMLNAESSDIHLANGENEREKHAETHFSHFPEIKQYNDGLDVISLYCVRTIFSPLKRKTSRNSDGGRWMSCFLFRLSLSCCTRLVFFAYTREPAKGSQS